MAIFLKPSQITRFGHKKELSQEPAFQTKFSRGGTTMLAITVLVAAAGLALGLRFNVIILALLVLLVITSIFAAGIWVGSNSLVVTLRLLATLASVQISYLVGCLIAAHIPTRVKTASGSV
jgi:hypothetical protein